MLINDLFQETFFAIRANKGRSGLTILGIIIGIGSVIAMMAVGQGAQQSIEDSIQSIGSNLIMIMPGAPQQRFGAGASTGQGSAQTLTIEDANALKTINLIKGIAPEISRRYQVIVKSKNTNTQITGTVADYLSVRNINLDSGVFISEQDVKSTNKVAVIAPSARDDLFGIDVNPIGKIIRIKDLDFKIIGLTKSKGGTGFGNQDDMIFIPISTAQRYLSGNNLVTTISIQSIDQSSLTEVHNQVNTILLTRHKIKDLNQADFRILNQADIVSAASSVTGIFTILLSSIAGISLIVGGIGIMNMMLTNVTERTREIGLRKAIGAKKTDISRQFLAESIMLTFIGGGLGILLGWGIAIAISKFAGITATVSTNSIGMAFGVSAGIGIIFGYYPARRAAKLNPIEALRYE